MSKSKYPRYVSVYDALLSDIQSGKYPAGCKLPGENELAKYFEVSRNTLRQAIMLLHEDGYVFMQQGRGTFVLRNDLAKRGSLDSLADPLMTMAVEAVERVDTQIEIRKISPKNQEIYGLDASKLLVLVETVCFKGERAIGCALSFIPYDMFAAERVPLDDMERVREFYRRLLTQPGLTAESILRVVNAREPVTKLMGITAHQTLLMLDETIKGGGGGVLMTQKVFFLPDAYEMRFIRRNDRSGGTVK